MSKGSWSRVQEHDQYRENFDRIFKVRKGKKAKPTQKHKDKKKEAKKEGFDDGSMDTE